jgi:glycosyltransferase involved in cell wall biosynthesis
MLAVLDARLGRNPSGIGQYVLNLARELGGLAGHDVGAVCSIRHARRFSHYRVRALPVVRRSAADAAFLRSGAAVVHGPNFHAPRINGLAQVATVHDLGFLHLPECHPPGMPERLDRLIQSSLPTTALFLCVSDWTREDFLERYGPPAERVRTVRLGVSERFGQASEADVKRAMSKHGIAAPFLMHVGAMVQRKDLGTLLRAFEILSEQCDDLNLVLAGHPTKGWASEWPIVSGWLTDNPRLATRVRVLKYVRDAEMPALYQGAACCISTSLMEGFGLFVLEGLASGRPVVATRGSAISEIGSDLVFYGEAREPESYAAAVLRALGAGVQNVGARQAYARSFTWRGTAEQTLEGYRVAEAVGAGRA